MERPNLVSMTLQLTLKVLIHVICRLKWIMHPLIFVSKGCGGLYWAFTKVVLNSKSKLREFPAEKFRNSKI